jgi:ParB/RepB/Spo0J family partition protein
MSTLSKQIDAANATLGTIKLALIDRNPENPRLIFRSGELEELLESIRQYGVQVPITVYRSGKRFVLIDGERRWKVSQRLGFKTIPALIQEPPTALDNLILMFNIHALREQWDLLTIALKLPRVSDLLEKKYERKPNEREIADALGIKRTLIRRSKLLVELPDKYKETILNELNKPKPQQKLTEDFFIEMERALKTVERAMPDVLGNKELARQSLISKYKAGVIANRVHFRLIAKIARAERVEADESAAKNVLKKLFGRNEYSIEAAYNDSVLLAYSERDLITLINRFLEQLDRLSGAKIDQELRHRLVSLKKRISSVLGKDR